MTSEEFTSLANLFTEPAALLDLDGTILAASRRFQRLGLGPKELVGRKLTDITASSEKDVLEYLRNCARTSESTLGAMTLVSSGGGSVPCRCDGKVVDGMANASAKRMVVKFVPHGESTTHFSILNQKIAELGEEIRRRQQYQVELAAQQESLRVTLTSIGDAVIVTDAEGRVTFLNPVAATLTGWSPQEAEGRSLQSIFHIVNEQSRKTVENPATRAIREGTIVGLANHTVLIAKNGTERPIDDSAAPVKDKHGNVFGAVLVFRDITERRIAVEKLRASEERFRLMADAAPVLIRLSGPQQNFTWFNKPWLDFVGRSMDQEIGSGWTDNVHPDDLSRCLHTYESGFKTQQPFSLEYRLRRHDGQYRWVLDNSVPNFDMGEFVGFLGSCIDITDRKRAEESLKVADRRKDEFLATLAHELRNPLAPIRTGLDVMRMTKDDPAAFEEVRETMQRQVEQLIRLVDDLLDVSRITRGKLELRKSRVALADVVQIAVDASRPYIDEEGHELNVRLPDDQVVVEADPNRLAQVLSNLLNNAAKYTPEGGKIWLTAELEGQVVVLSVRDTGQGIAPDKLEYIFEMFGQIERHEQQYTGLGIGLTLVKRLVEMHRGSIEVHSDGAGKGSDFRIRLPIATAEPAAADPVPEKQPASAPHKLRVLVVDDNRDVGLMLSRIVQMFGHEVDMASDGLQAIEMAQMKRPDVILMDLGMPQMNGYEAAEHIRQKPWGKDIFLVAVTGWGQAEDRQRTKSAGFDHHLVKPADPAILKSLLEGVQSRDK